MNRSHIISAISAIALVVAPHCLAQGTLADYERADNFGKQTSGKVFNDRVTPNWTGNGAEFWYRARTGLEQHHFYRINPDRGERVDAFDHLALAKKLTDFTGTQVSADNLPFQSFEFVENGATITFTANGSSFKFHLADGTLTETKPAASDNGTTVKILPAIRAAVSNGDDTEVSFVNRTDKTIFIYWIGSAANPTPYGSIEPGERLDQHTFAGHVWLARDKEGTTLGVFEAIASPGLAVVDGSWKPGRPENSPRRRYRDRNRNRTEVESPDGKWRAAVLEHNVTLTEIESGESTQLSDTGTETDPFLPRIYWSPASRHLVVIQERKEPKRVVHIVESSPNDALQPKLQSFDYVKPGDPLDHPRPRLFAIESKQQIPIDDSLFANPWDLSDFHWSLDSSQFSFLYNERGHRILRLVDVNAEDGTAASLIEEAPETFVCYSSKSYNHPLDASNEVIWMSERDGWNHLYLFDSRTGALKNQITSGEWVVRGVDRIDPEKRQIWFQAGGIYPEQDPYHIHYCRVDFDGTNLVRLTEGDGTHDIEYSPDHSHFVDTYSRVDLPPVTELRRTSDGSKVMNLGTADASELIATGWQMPERFVAKGRDGKTDIWGVIYKPSTFDPEQRYPVIEKIYAGPHSSHVPKRFSSNGASMAELGFIIVQIDGMGTSNRSKAFHDVCWQNLGDAGFPDRVLWIKAAAESRPWMDLSRVGIYGGSAGGQNAMRALIAHHDFYRVAVADCGCHDNRIDKIWWNEQWMGYPVGKHYAASSNVDQAHRLDGKLMLIVGELDRNVDPASTMQVADALIKADKDFDLVVIPGAGHGAAGTPYGKRRQRDFFVRNLLGVEPRHTP
ncbi:MAG: prolyl oligopeptidase family serine peptidase [Verrucomicrobiales bacterium]